MEIVCAVDGISYIFAVNLRLRERQREREGEREKGEGGVLAIQDFDFWLAN